MDGTNPAYIAIGLPRGAGKSELAIAWGIRQVENWYCENLLIIGFSPHSVKRVVGSIVGACGDRIKSLNGSWEQAKGLTRVTSSTIGNVGVHLQGHRFDCAILEDLDAWPRGTDYVSQELLDLLPRLHGRTLFTFTHRSNLPALPAAMAAAI